VFVLAGGQPQQGREGGTKHIKRKARNSPNTRAAKETHPFATKTLYATRPGHHGASFREIANPAKPVIEQANNREITGKPKSRTHQNRENFPGATTPEKTAG